ncbi:MAG TPA: twin transmembrane helix small protein [Sphingomonadales bacterium]|nr:twin transmembrane helix small protein [Sphingomonadales bacterium]
MSAAQIIVLGALAVTLGILLVGVLGMARGGEFNKKYGNTLMRLRVIAQFTALALMALFAWLAAR